MADQVPAPAGQGGFAALLSGGGQGLSIARGWGRRPDLLIALFVVAIVVGMIFPVPAPLLDILLAFSITFSVVILMIALFVQKPLEFSSFPTILLVATLIRLALNIASTRLILTHGHTGTDAAGHVIEAFSGLVMAGDFIIGLVVFAILVIVNFVVITKGSGRIAEVSARFSLDAMPGKQMAIDADLSAGLINEDQARARRKELEEESSFFGSMDGAAKFVRGDAIAGLIITFINIVMGVIIGVVRHDLGAGEAFDIYTRLTVGDGLVTQVPALVVSVAAGLLVSKAGVGGSADKALLDQMTIHPKALGISAFLMLFLALLPGMPKMPFLLLAGLAGYGAYYYARQQDAAAKKKTVDAEAAKKKPAVVEEPISTALAIDLVRLELGYGLLPLINSEQGKRLTDQIKGLRRQLAGEVGFIMPSVRIQDNLQLPPNGYVLRIKEIEVGKGEIRPTMLLVMDPRGETITIPGETTREPTFGLPAMWIDPSFRDEALFKGYTVVDPPTVITTHLTEIIKDNMPELLSHTETQKLLDELDKPHQKLVGDVIPSQITVGALQRILQNLLAERVSIRDLPAILEGISEACGYTRNITAITEHVRARLSRQISHQHTNEAGFIPLVTLSPSWETEFAQSLAGDGEDKQLAMAPSRLQDFINAVRQTFERFAMMGETPVLLTSPAVRPYVRSVIERFRGATAVLSQNEIHPKAKIKTLGQV
jgi:flagellar biosynthesis protein FlhA